MCSSFDTELPIRAVIPYPIAEGVFGIALIITFDFFSQDFIEVVFTPAATEMMMVDGFTKLLTSLITGSNIRTMWMTPFYLFFGTLFVYLFQVQINLKKLKSFMIGFIFFFFLSPGLYAYVSISNDGKRTDYMGIAIKTLYAWDLQFDSKINVVLGDEWSAGNLSYHLISRPVWEGFVEREKLDQLKDYMCLDSVCIGSR